MEKNLNKNDIKRFYNFIGHEKQSELRFIEPRWKNPKPVPKQEWANNFDQFLFLCEKNNGNMNLYVGINERKPTGDKDDDVEYITCIGHDIDAHSGGQESFLKAQEVAIKIKDDCIAKGYNEPMMVCSGRGFWIIHKVTPIENTKENQKRIKQFGKFIKEKYEVEGIEIDSSVYNASRIVRIPGTLNISDKENPIMSFIVNEPEAKPDLKLTDKIINLELPKHTIVSDGETPKSSCAFMDYCLSHEIPAGERHRVISRNMAIYIQKHPDRELLREQYFKIQKGSETELDQWLKGLDENPDVNYPFSCGELINFQRKYNIPIKCKGCPKHEEYKKEKKAEKKLAEEKEKEARAETLGKAITFFSDKKNLAEQFVKVNPIYYDQSRLWWIWDEQNKKWVIGDETDIMNSLSKCSEADTISSKERNEILEALRQVSRMNKPEEVKKTWIQFKDTIIDFETDDEFEADSKYFITNPIPYPLHKERISDTPTIDKIFKQWVGEEHVKTLYEIIAYSLITYYPLHRIFCFVGAGMNGKSKFLELLRKFVGNNNCCSTELDTLMNSKFEVFRLYKKLVCQMGETNFNEMNKTSILKKLSGGDLIGFEKKRCDPFEANNYAKILISTNNLPTTTDKTIGFYRRWLIVDFPNQFSEKKDILSEIPEEEYECLTVKCLEILKDLMNKREFHNEGSIEDRMKKYEERSNPFDKFWREQIKEDYDSFITKAQFKKILNEWCKENNFRELSDQSINKKMKENNIDLDSRDYMNWYDGGQISKKLVRVWKGIKIYTGNMTDMTEKTTISC